MVFVIVCTEPFADGVEVLKAYDSFKYVTKFLKSLDDTDDIRVMAWNNGSMEAYYEYVGGTLNPLWTEEG